MSGPPTAGDARPVRAVAVATIAYSVAIIVAPRLLARPLGMIEPGGAVPSHVAGLVRGIGVRDCAVAAALALSPSGPPMTALTAARVAADLGDAVWLARAAKRDMRAKVAVVAAGWGALQVAALMRSRRDASLGG